MGDVTTEGSLRELWQQLLAVADIHDDSNFFTLGGHSMLATRLMSRARRTLGVDLPARLIFDRPVFGPFVAGVEAVLAGGADTDRPVVAITGATTGPLSLQQEQLMLVESVLGPSPANHTAVAVELGTTPDIPVLRHAVELLRTRHDALRTRFAATASGHTQSTVPADTLPPLVFEEHDLRSVPANKVEVRARRLVRGLFLTPFDLAGGETLRAQLFHRDTGADVLVLHVHHLSCDGVSHGILLDDLDATYSALAAGQPPPAPPAGVGYQDYARWQHDNRERLVRASAAHWRDTVLSLADADPTSAGRAGGSGVGTVERTTRVLDTDVVARAARWATPQGLTEFAVVTAAVAAGMAELTGRTRIGVGVLLDNRTIVEVERTVGPFAISALLAVPTAEGDTGLAVVRSVREQWLAAQRWAALPLEVLPADPLAEFAFADAGELVDVVVAMDTARDSRPTSGRLAMTRLADVGKPLVATVLGPPLTVSVNVADSGTTRLTVERRTGADGVPTAVDVLDGSVRALLAIADDPAAPVVGTPIAGRR